MPDVRMGWELMGKLRAILAHLYYTQADYSRRTLSLNHVK